MDILKLIKITVCLWIVAVAVGIGYLWATIKSHEQKPMIWRQADTKGWPSKIACITPNDRETAMFKTALTAIELDGKDNLGGSLSLGAMEFMSHPLYRRDGLSVCTPESELKRLSSIINARGYINNSARLTETGLNLVSRLPAVSAPLIKEIANTAFAKEPQQSETFVGEDIRPLARSVLASLGSASRDYSDQAFEEMSWRDSMGIGAAQIAVATGHPQVLPKIEKMMYELLASYPKDDALPYHALIRMRELSWALYLGGADAKNHTTPIKNMMRRKVVFAASPTFVADINPKELCGVLEKIEGPEALKPFAYCAKTNANM